VIAFVSSYPTSFSLHTHISLLPGLWLDHVQLFIGAYRRGKLSIAYSRIGSVLTLRTSDWACFRIWRHVRPEKMRVL